MVDVPSGHFFLGGKANDEGKAAADDPLFLEASDLTTHGVIVGMTGSGKTGLSIVMLEEALMSGIPTLIIDPKGDMGNLLLSFPELAGPDFEDWVNPGDADREGVSVSEHAANTAEMWKNGLDGWGIQPERIAALRAKADFTIYTPGSTSGIPLNIIGDLKAPPAGTNPETMQDEIEGFASSILGLVGVESDPISGREHILLSNIIAHHWNQGRDLDLGGLLMAIQDPPMRKLGVLDLDTFFAPKDRTALAMKLNGLMASPSFASWTQGPALDIDTMLNGGGKPNAAIISLAHLSDEERQFVVTLVLSKVVTWMRGLAGTPDLRALIYMDEVFGFVPPTAAPPSKKPILTILKQARAFGIGMVLSTQNPVDIDYKAISNAGTWMIGRLQTERDKARLLEGMNSGGDLDIGAVGETISGLDKRQFVMHSTRGSGPQVFGTRWAMSYLPGPITRDQISELMADHPLRNAPAEPAPAPAGAQAATPSPAPATAASAAAPAPTVADDETTVAPDVADGYNTYYLDPAVPWAETVGAVSGGTRLEPAVVARVNLLFDDTKGDLRHQEEYEAVFFPLAGGALDPDDAIDVDYDDRDFRSDPPAGARYVLPDAKINTKTYFTKAQSALKDHLYRNEVLELFQNKELKLISRVGESREDFAARCEKAADDGADEEATKIREALEKKRDRVADAISKAEDRVREIEHDADSRSRDAVVSGAIDVAGSVLGGLLGGRRSTRGILGGVRRASSKQRTTANAKERLASAENRLDEKVDELEGLEQEITDSLYEIQDAWDEKAEAIDDLSVTLEKTDISVDEIAVVWIPTNG